MNLKYRAVAAAKPVAVKHNATITKNGSRGCLVSKEPVIQGTFTFMPKNPLINTQGSRLIVRKVNLARTLLISAFDLYISSSTYFWYFSMARVMTFDDFSIISS